MALFLNKEILGYDVIVKLMISNDSLQLATVFAEPHENKAQ
jgi:hypothetical protein